MKKVIKKLKNKKRVKLLRMAILLACVTTVFALMIYSVYAATRAGLDYYADNTTSTHYGILNKISEHIKLPDEEVKVLLKVKNPDELKKESAFYEDVEKDNYIVIYPSLAVIYDANKDIVLKTVVLKE